MPARSKTTDTDIVRAARDLVDSKGRDGFSMRDVAEAVGIRAPSLYGRFKHRADLLAAVELQLWTELADLLACAVIKSEPTATLMAQAQAIRSFARRSPKSYALFFDVRSAPTAEGTAARGAAVAQLLSPLKALLGEQRAFAAARVLVPFMHGFISMELADGFRLGGGVDEAFEHGVSVVLRGAARPPGVDPEA
jgi:AcrR family transcriptional regulator